MTRIRTGSRVAMASNPGKPIGIVESIVSWKAFSGRMYSAEVKLDESERHHHNFKECVFIVTDKLVVYGEEPPKRRIPNRKEGSWLDTLLQGIFSRR